VFYFWYPQFVALGAASERDVVDVFSDLAHSAVYIGAAVLLVFGAIDFLLQRRKFYRELSMSLDDLRREHKDEEGDPHIRSARKHMHQTLSNEDITARVRRSKVIVVEARDSK